MIKAAVFATMILILLVSSRQGDGRLAAASPGPPPSAEAPSAQASPADASPPSYFAIDIFPQLAFDRPSVVTHAGDSRLFVVEEAGRIWVIKGKGDNAEMKLFLDITDRVLDGCERGLLGLAFHPQYAENGYFYVNYIADVDGGPTHIARFQVSDNPNRAERGSELLMLEIAQPACNHNGGDVHFDPEGMLVMALGDGGYGGDPFDNGQSTQSMLGKLLRIDVDRTAGDKNYAIPDDNPFIGQDPLDEIWMLGLRNPWRFSFDRLTGDLFIGDVGQDTWEEVNYVAAEDAGGQNFGWSLKEGPDCFDPATGCDPGGLTDPIYVFEHVDDECHAITGGFVYRGPSLDALQGAYVFADYCDGQIYRLDEETDGRWRRRTLLTMDAPLSTFGEDEKGELYFALRGGKIYRLDAEYRSHLPFLSR